MGVIYRDGVAYGGISSIAGNVSYDNSTSHLQSSTVQNAITELKSIIDSKEYTSIAFVNSLPAATNAQYNTLYIVDSNNDGVFELWVIKTTLGQKAWVAVGDNSKITALQESVAALQTEISGLSYIASASIDNTTGNLVLTDSDNNTVTLQLDSSPTENSKKPITSGAVYTALDDQVGKKEYVNNELKGEIFNSYSGNTKNVASGDRSHAEGLGTTAEGSESHAEGLHTTASGNQSHAEGNVTKANGSSSHAEGDNTIANGSSSHAEGYNTITKNQSSHAEGFCTTTVRNHSHAEGDNTVAVGVASHTEGVGTKALEQASHAGGYYTKSAKKYETVIGKYNLPFEDTDLIVSELIDNSYYLLTIPVYKIYYYNSYTLSATSIAIPNELKEHLPSSVGDYGIPYVICDNNKVETELWGCLRATAAGEEKTVSISMLPSNQNYLKNYNSSTLYIKVYADTTQLIDAYWKKTTETIPDSLFVIGNGRDGGNRSNIVEVDTTSLNVNGDIKQNGVSITPTPHTELTQAQYDALQNPDAGTEFFITDASSGVVISSLESRLAALEMQETVYYINGVQRVPLYSQNITKVVKVDDNTVDWYFLEPTSQKTYKARVTAQGEGNTRTNPLIVVTEITE